MLRLFAALLASVLLPACDSGTEADLPNLDGQYSYAASFNPQTEATLSGTLVISDQKLTRMTVTQTITLRDRGMPIFVLLSAAPAEAVLNTRGEISWQHRGTITTEGRERSFAMEHDGDVAGRAISGTWTITWEDGSTQRGTFAAQQTAG